ncbi:hypothetical protein V9T40_005592 [Parthenolecanium corni]|uniref:CCHC-type domain-containing protein n=1 Tax=Parthenolecanium corni TaxID=536013 RepID=A0AAN9TUG8_9HEMI
MNSDNGTTESSNSTSSPDDNYIKDPDWRPPTGQGSKDDRPKITCEKLNKAFRAARETSGLMTISNQPQTETMKCLDFSIVLNKLSDEIVKKNLGEIESEEPASSGLTQELNRAALAYSDSGKNNFKNFEYTEANFCDENYAMNKNTHLTKLQICDEIFKMFDNTIAINILFEDKSAVNFVRNDYKLIKRCVNFADDSPPVESVKSNPLNLPESYLNQQNMETNSPIRDRSPLRVRSPIKEISPPTFSPEEKESRIIVPRYRFTRQVIELPVKNLEINDFDTILNNSHNEFKSDMHFLHLDKDFKLGEIPKLGKKTQFDSWIQKFNCNLYMIELYAILYEPDVEFRKHTIFEYKRRLEFVNTEIFRYTSKLYHSKIRKYEHPLDRLNCLREIKDSERLAEIMCLRHRINNQRYDPKRMTARNFILKFKGLIQKYNSFENIVKLDIHEITCAFRYAAFYQNPDYIKKFEKLDRELRFDLTLDNLFLTLEQFGKEKEFYACEDSWLANERCYACHANGHIARDCPIGNLNLRKCYNCEKFTTHISRDCPLKQLGISIRHGVSYRIDNMPPRRHGYSTLPQQNCDLSNLFTRRDEMPPVDVHIPQLEPDWTDELEYRPPGAPRQQIVLDRAFMLAIGNELFASSLLGVERMDVSDEEEDNAGEERQ